MSSRKPSEHFGHAGRRVGHAQQLKGDFIQIKSAIADYLGLSPDHTSIQEPLEDHLGLNDGRTYKHAQIEDKIASGLPPLGPGYADFISFERLKDPKRLREKLNTGDRDTHDTYGIQLWIANPKLMRLVEKLQSPQAALSKGWREKGINVEIDNHFADPKAHGYRAIHLNFICPGNNGWREDLELQIIPAQMMNTYLSTRPAYTAMRALEEYVKSTKGKNQNLWSDNERALIYPLRDYINALYEADTHECGLMNMVNYEATHRPASRNADEARANAEELEPIVEIITTSYRNVYLGNPRDMINHADRILEQHQDYLSSRYPEMNLGQHAPGKDMDSPKPAHS